MDTDMHDTELVARLRRLDAASAAATPQFDYQGMLDRRAERHARTQRRQSYARGTAAAVLVALIGASFWRLDSQGDPAAPGSEVTPAASQAAAEPRIVRADTYLAVAELEDHIASIDDALNVVRVYAPRGAEVARLEQTRAELVDSYARVRYAEMVSANF
jgi:hypothetical protein